jgi:hypothetical protein
MRNSRVPRSISNAPAFSRAAARAAAVTDVQLQQRSLVRVTHGWYRSGKPLDAAQRCEALAEAIPWDAVFSDATAAELYGLPVPAALCGDRVPTHITLSPRACIPRRKELVVHRRALAPEETEIVSGLQVTSPERTFLDLAMTLSAEQLTVIGDAALSRGLTSEEGLAATAALAHRRRGLRLCREVIPRLDGRAQSPPETVMRLRLAAAGMPATPQCAVYSAAGELLGHLDLGYEEHKVGIEYEGRHHVEEGQFGYDIRRYSTFSAAGWLIVRCGRLDLRDGSKTLVRYVREAIASRSR